MQGWQDWITLVGLVLSCGGLVVTLYGLDSLSRDTFPNRPLPHRLLWSWFQSSILKRRRSVAPTPAPLSVTVSFGTTDSKVGRRQPMLGSSGEAWVEYWESRLDDLAMEIKDVKEQIGSQEQDLVERLAREAAERQAGDAELLERTKSWLGGSGGKGLTAAWWGLLATLVGMLLQGIASIAAS